jgi:hypothetical protein
VHERVQQRSLDARHAGCIPSAQVRDSIELDRGHVESVELDRGNALV